MAKYQPSDEGSNIGGRTVVYMAGSFQSLAVLLNSERAALAAANVAMLAEAAKDGAPFCAECEQAKRKMAELRAKKR